MYQELSYMYVYSGLWTPWEPDKVVCTERCPLFGVIYTKKHIWDTATCPQYRGVLISLVSFKRGSTVVAYSQLATVSPAQ